MTIQQAIEQLNNWDVKYKGTPVVVKFIDNLMLEGRDVLTMMMIYRDPQTQETFKSSHEIALFMLQEALRKQDAADRFKEMCTEIIMKFIDQFRDHDEEIQHEQEFEEEEI